MKLIAGSVLVLVFLDIFHCAPLMNNDYENGHYRERKSSKQWQRTFGVGLNLGAEAGIKDGAAYIQSKNRLGFDVGGYDNDNSKELEYPMYPTPPPFHFGSAFDYTNQYYPANGLSYGTPQYPPPYFPQYPQYPFQYPQQYWQQYNPQYQPQYNPQFTPQQKPSPPNGTKNKPPNSSQESNNEENVF